MDVYDKHVAKQHYSVGKDPADFQKPLCKYTVTYVAFISKTGLEKVENNAGAS